MSGSYVISNVVKTVNVCVKHFHLYKLPKSKLTNTNILCLVRFGSSRNKFVKLMIRSRNSGSQTVRSLVINSEALTKLATVNYQLQLTYVQILHRLYNVACDNKYTGRH